MSLTAQVNCTNPDSLKRFRRLNWSQTISACSFFQRFRGSTRQLSSEVGCFVLLSWDKWIKLLLSYSCCGVALSLSILACPLTFGPAPAILKNLTTISQSSCQKHSTDSISTFSGVIYNEWKCVFSKMWQWSMETRNSTFIYFAFGIKDKGLSALNKQLNIFIEFF